MEKDELYREMSFFKYISQPLKEAISQIDIQYIDKLSTCLKNYFRYYFYLERKGNGYALQ